MSENLAGMRQWHLSCQHRSKASRMSQCMVWSRRCWDRVVERRRFRRGAISILSQDPAERNLVPWIRVHCHCVTRTVQYSTLWSASTIARILTDTFSEKSHSSGNFGVPLRLKDTPCCNSWTVSSSSFHWRVGLKALVLRAGERGVAVA